MKKIVILTNIPAPYRVDLFNHLAEKYPRYEFHFVFSMQVPGDREWSCTLPENAVFLKNRAFYLKGKYDTRRIILTYGLRGILKKIKPDLIVASEYNFSSQIALSYAKSHKIPFVSWSDGTALSERGISKLQRRLRRRVFKNAAAFLASSTKTAELQISYGADPAKIYKSLLTVDTAKYRQVKTEYSNHLLYVGSTIPRKGLDLLFAALAHVKNDYILDIVGADKLPDDLKAQAEALGITDKISLHGFIQAEEIRKYYDMGGVFVLPTREDCFGLVILEAMCASLPVVISKYADGAYDLFTDGVEGLLVDPEDPEEFGAALDRLLSDPALRQKMGALAQARTETLGIAPSATDFVKALDSLLSESGETI